MEHMHRVSPLIGLPPLWMTRCAFLFSHIVSHVFELIQQAVLSE